MMMIVMGEKHDFQTGGFAAGKTNQVQVLTFVHLYAAEGRVPRSVGPSPNEQSLDVKVGTGSLQPPSPLSSPSLIRTPIMSRPMTWVLKSSLPMKGVIDKELMWRDAFGILYKSGMH